jgi:hypothetical protein
MEEAERVLAACDKSSNKHVDYSDNQKTYLKLKLLSAAAATRKAAVSVHTGKGWAKKLREDPDWDIYERQTNKIRS